MQMRQNMKKMFLFSGIALSAFCMIFACSISTQDLNQLERESTRKNTSDPNGINSDTTPPVITVISPLNNTSYTGDLLFSGTASDTQDGSPTASLAWRSSVNGSIGTGGSFSTSNLSVGTHTITASALRRMRN